MMASKEKWYDCPRPGRNDPCPCGSGEKTKRCCASFFACGPLTDTDEASVRLCWEELWTGRVVMPGSYSQHVARMDGPWLSEMVARASWYLGDQLRTRRTELELGLCDEFLDAISARKVRAWIESGRRQKVIHRTNALALQQVNLSLGRRSGACGDDAALRHAVEALIKANDVLDDDIEARPNSMAVGGHLDALLAANFHRIAFDGHEPDFGSAFGRFWAIMCVGFAEAATKRPHAAFDLLGEFRTAFRLDLEELLALGLGLLSYYKGLSREQFNKNAGAFFISERFFDAITNPTTKSRVWHGLEYLGLTWDEHAREMRERTQKAPGNLHQWSSLYRHPLVRADEKVFYPLDLGFCAAQVTDGVYWALLERLDRDGRRADGDRLRTAFGHAFEWYVSEIVRALHRPAEGTRVWCGWDDQIREVKGISTPDIVVLENNTLYVIEATVAAVPPAAAISADPVVLRESLERIWLGHGDVSAKLVQLESAWRSASARRLSVDGLDWDQVRRVEPVFLSLRPFPQHPAIAPLYRQVLESGGRTGEFVDNLTILSAEEWEMVCGLRLEGARWEALWQKRRSGRYSQHSMATLLFQSGLLHDVSPQLKHFIDAAMERMKALLFPETHS